MGILHNRARRHYRVEQRRPDPSRIARERTAPDPRERMVGAEIVQRVRGAIHRLPDVHRSVVDLHVRHGMSPREIARSLCRPRSTVRTQLARGLGQLRVLLAPLQNEVG